MLSKMLHQSHHKQSEISLLSNLSICSIDSTTRAPLPRAVGESDEYFKLSSLINQHANMGKSSPIDYGDIISLLQEIVRTLRILHKNDIHINEKVTLHTVLVRETSNRFLNACHKWKIGFPFEPRDLTCEKRSEESILDDIYYLCQQLELGYDIDMPQLRFSCLKSLEKQLKMINKGLGKNFQNKQKFFTSLPEHAVYTDSICTTKGRVSSFQIIDCAQCQCHTCKLKRKSGLQLNILECSCGRQRNLSKRGKTKGFLLQSAARIRILMMKLCKWLRVNCPANVTGVIVGFIAAIITAPAGGAGLAIGAMVVSTIIAWLLQFSIETTADAWS